MGNTEKQGGGADSPERAMAAVRDVQGTPGTEHAKTDKKKRDKFDIKNIQPWLV